MTEVCQKPPVVLEIDAEKNGYAEYKLPVGYRIEDIVAYVLSELDHLFGMTAWAEPPAFAAKCQEIFMAAVWIRAPDPGEAFLQKFLIESKLVTKTNIIKITYYIYSSSKSTIRHLWFRSTLNIKAVAGLALQYFYILRC